MTEEDSLYEKNFSYRETKNHRLQIFWRGREVLVVTGKAAVKLQSKLAQKTDSEKQLTLAKVTGNFKRGNEREGKLKR